MSGVRRSLPFAAAGFVAIVVVLVLSASWQENEAASTNVAASARGSGNQSDEPEFVIPSEQIDDLERRALAGDNFAASILGNHYMALRARDEEKRWHGLAANRGSCASMSSMRQIALDDNDQRARAHWNEMMRRNVCTWGKTYPMFSDDPDASLPLWDE